jgi:hypothetical protein
VSSSSRPAWRQLLQPVLDAGSLAEAQLATSDLIDAVLPGGAVLDDDAAELVREVRATTDLAARPHRAYVIGVLATMASWAHVWRDQVDGGVTSAVATTGASAERQTAEELARASKDLTPLSDDRDPEVRGLMYLLMGGAGTATAESGELLRQRAVGEDVELARACAHQALVRLAARTSASHAAEIGAWLAQAQRAESDVVGRRVRAELESNARTPDGRQRLEASLGMRAVDLPAGPVPTWTAERV